MEIIFFGTAQFACSILERLIKDKQKVLAVVTQGDRPMGRHLEITEMPVKVLSKKLKLNLLQPVNLNDDKFIKQLKDLNADVFVVASFGKILKRNILDLPKKMCINIHSSLLPKYRGAAPINWAIANGEIETGITIIKMNEEMDKGDIILQDKIAIKHDDTFISLSEKLSIKATDCLIKVLELLKSNKIEPVPQKDKEASYAPKLKKEDGLINWNNSAVDIYNKMRAFYPWPGSFTYLEGKLLKIYSAEIISVKKALPEPGNIQEISKEGITVAAGKGGILIKQLQMEGRRRMSAEEFIVGHKLQLGQRLG